jgi:hypothetical protein
MTRSNAAKEPGTASPFADFRGGPANFGGVNFQVDYTVFRVLRWLHEHWGDPTGTGVVRCEARLVNVPPDASLRVAQHGFDVGITNRNGLPPEYLEIKRTPTKDEVVELLASIGHLPQHPDEVTVGMVSEKPTAPFLQLKELYRLAHEATNDEELRQLVVAKRSDTLLELLDAVGVEAHARLHRMREPELRGQTELSEFIEWHAHPLAGGREAGRRLVDRVSARISDASERREAVPLASLQAELLTAGLLQARPASAPPENEELAAVMSALGACPSPVPKTVLANSLGQSVLELERGMFAPALAVGAILEVGDGYLRSPHVAQLSTDFAGSRAGDLLEALTAYADQVGIGASGQTVNALILARLCEHSDPELVGRLFQVFDRPSKRWGDLGVVLELSYLADRALQTIFRRNLTSDEATKWAYVKAQTYICGQGWVMQRVGELDSAMKFMDRAKEISERYHDDINHAFTLKCEGRLLRMEAEQLRYEDPRRAELLERSATMLRDGEAAFNDVVLAHPKYKEDPGECVSLLARTLATSLEFESAKSEAARAAELLAPSPSGKAYADLKILQAELFLRVGNRDAVDYHDERAEHLDQLDALIAQHSRDERDAPGGRDRGASEVVARLHHTIGQLQEGHDDDAAVDRYMRAAELYGILEYRPGEEDSLLKARLLTGELIPDDLRLVLDEAAAPAGVVLMALDAYRAQSTGLDVGATIEPGSQAGSDANEEWKNIVDEVSARYWVSRPRWVDKQASA